MSCERHVSAWGSCTFWGGCTICLFNIAYIWWRDRNHGWRWHQVQRQINCIFFPRVHYALLHLFFFFFLFYDPEPVGTSNKAPPLKHNVSWHRANKPHSIVKFAIFVDAPGSGDMLHSLLITLMSQSSEGHFHATSAGVLWSQTTTLCLVTALWCLIYTAVHQVWLWLHHKFPSPT